MGSGDNHCTFWNRELRVIQLNTFLHANGKIVAFHQSDELLYINMHQFTSVTFPPDDNRFE
ncbi:CLUMA_CG021054, isoform A [Clunio marinus]|uniref:CLUMA_CG021054, isoform A n=1 Tax=Clunio marinus TaxID=568069 RepID=A0A1J1JAR7_9DIPT|nr:CLUMA_CG021054, isoform A [Clunio marinus]